MKTSFPFPFFVPYVVLFLILHFLHQTCPLGSFIKSLVPVSSVKEMKNTVLSFLCVTVVCNFEVLSG